MKNKHTIPIYIVYGRLLNIFDEKNRMCNSGDTHLLHSIWHRISCHHFFLLFHLKQHRNETKFTHLATTTTRINYNSVMVWALTQQRSDNCGNMRRILLNTGSNGIFCQLADNFVLPSVSTILFSIFFSLDFFLFSSSIEFVKFHLMLFTG